MVVLWLLTNIYTYGKLWQGCDVGVAGPADGGGDEARRAGMRTSGVTIVFVLPASNGVLPIEGLWFFAVLSSFVSSAGPLSSSFSSSSTSSICYTVREGKEREREGE